MNMQRIKQKNRNFKRQDFCLPSNGKSQATIISDAEVFIKIPNVLMAKLLLISEARGIDLETLIRIDGLGHVFNQFWNFRENRPKEQK